MVVEQPALLGVEVDTLSTGSVDVVVGRKDDSAATLEAVDAVLVLEAALVVGRGADTDRVLLASGWPVLVETAALASGEEKVKGVVALNHVGSLDGVLACGLVDELGGAVLAESRAGEVDVELEEILPEGAEVDDVAAVEVHELTVNGVVAVASLGAEDGAKVGP